MELLDIYDENGNFLGVEDRKVVHEKGLWHKTIHCWLYTSTGDVYFQIREHSKKFYTTASGHVQAGESLEQAFSREIKEEIGVDLDYDKAKKISVVIWKMDKEKEDGSMYIDRAFSNVYGYEIAIKPEFLFDENEVIGVAKVNAKETLALMKNELEEIPAEITYQDHVEHKNVKREDFLLQKGETYLGKYGEVLNFVIANTNE